MAENRHVIVLGNEKGGSGKTTTAMHLIVSLLNMGFKVGSIDIDFRQQSLTRYIDNRKKFCQQHNIPLAIPDHYSIARKHQRNIPNQEELAKQEIAQLMKVLEELSDHDFVVIDTPGSDNEINRLAHSYADTAITPINDSHVDLDVIGQVDADNLEVITPGVYSAMFWEQKIQKAARCKSEINWLVVRNRLASLDSLNKRTVEMALTKLSRKLGFKIIPGFGDRVIFKELFLKGLTLHDAKITDEVRMTSSVVAARQELRKFIQSLGIEKINNRLKEEMKESA
jgi:chromosome partitioning protein